MKRIIYLLAITLSSCFVACSGEDNLTPSWEDRNWWVNTDSDDPLDHLIYEVYEQYKVPIFYNDTIGAVNRGKDAFGNPDMYYEIIKLDYRISGSTSDAASALYTLSFNQEDITDGVELLRDYVFPKLPDFVPAQRSYLLVDTLWLGVTNPREQIPYSASAYAGLTTVAVGKLREIKDMSEGEKLLLGGEIIAAPIASKVYDRYEKNLLPQKFFKEITLAAFAWTGYGDKIDASYTGSMYPAYDHWYNFGFLYPALDKEQREGSLYYLPNKKQDVENFVALCLGFTEEQVKQEYGEYQHIMNKYYFMMEIIETLKTDLNNEK